MQHVLDALISPTEDEHQRPKHTSSVAVTGAGLGTPC